MNTRRTIILLGSIAVLAAGICAAQTRFGPGFRRGWVSHDGPIVRTEGGDYVNEDTVRTARETASHSTGTP